MEKEEITLKRPDRITYNRSVKTLRGFINNGLESVEGENFGKKMLTIGGALDTFITKGGRYDCQEKIFVIEANIKRESLSTCKQSGCVIMKSILLGPLTAVVPFNAESWSVDSRSGGRSFPSATAFTGKTETYFPIIESEDQKEQQSGYAHVVQKLIGILLNTTSESYTLFALAS